MIRTALAALAIVATAVWLAYPQNGSDPAPHAATVGATDSILAPDMVDPTGSGSAPNRPALDYPVADAVPRPDLTRGRSGPMAAAPHIDVVLPVEDFHESAAADYRDEGSFIDADPAASDEAFPEPVELLDEGAYLDADAPPDAWVDDADGVQDTGVPLVVD